jgi:hypothetical protein
LPEELRGNDDAVAPRAIAADEVADDLFGVALGVDVRGVDEIAAALKELRHDRLGLGHRRSPAPVFAKRHSAQTEWTHAKS